MKLYGLLGFPLSHSFSKDYFGDRLRYENFEYPSVQEFMNNKPDCLAGFNVTIPHKRDILPLMDHLSHEAREIGAVNCVKVDDYGNMKGYNTDAYGFEISLLELIGNQRPKVLVLGDGGAAKAVIYVLKKLGLIYKIVSRKSDFNYESLTNEIIKEHRLIVNTTPVGMAPHTQEAPKMPYCAVTKNHYLYDLIYNPAQTLFIKYGRLQGASVMNGLKMLRLQAEKSYDIWNNDK